MRVGIWLILKEDSSPRKPRFKGWNKELIREKTKIRLVTVDMDGTLLDDKSKISQRSLDVISRAQSQGIIFSICTGRFFENISILAKDYGIDCPLISLNGGKTALAPFGECITSYKMPLESAQTTFRRLEELDAHYFVFGDGFVAISHPGDMHHSQIDFGSRMEKEANTSYFYGKEACKQGIGRGIYKFYIHAKGDSRKLAHIRNNLLDIPDVNLTQSSSSNIEIMPRGVDKGKGVRDLAGYFNIPLDEVMAIGDQDNDLSMLQAAGLSVAMGNATPEVKALADIITLSNAQDGAAEAIERYALSCEACQA
jgi:Cof subfamily protein (haloacid dehalogenase superfamily)